MVSTATAQPPGGIPGSPPGGFPGGPPPGFPGGFPGEPFELPQPGQVLSSQFQEELKLTVQQKKQLQTLQKEVDAKLAKILTAEQRNALREPPRPGGFGF